MSKEKRSIKNIIFIVIIALLIIPQTRQKFQIALHTLVAKLSPNLESDRKQISSYNWSLQDLEGNSFNLNKTKGKLVLVNIWATWCPPCIAEMPSLQLLYNDYKDKMDFVLVSNEQSEVIKKFLDSKSYNFKIYTSQVEAPAPFNVRSIPRTFLLDQQGNIIIDESGAANWNSNKVRQTIDDLLKL